MFRRFGRDLYRLYDDRGKIILNINGGKKKKKEKKIKIKRSVQTHINLSARRYGFSNFATRGITVVYAGFKIKL